jgi:hypothetical protein
VGWWCWCLQVSVCGKNNHGQLGLPPDRGVERRPVRLGGLPPDWRFVMAACGAAHTLLLTGDRRVVAFGANQNGQLGQGTEESVLTDHFAPVEVTALAARNVFSITAGGDQSFALSLEKTATGGQAWDEGTLDLVRKFSVVKPLTSFCSAAALQVQVRSLFSTLLMTGM